MNQCLEKSHPTTIFLQLYRAEGEWDLGDQPAYDIQVRALYDQFVDSLRKCVHSTNSSFARDTLGKGLIKVENDLHNEELLAAESITGSDNVKMFGAILSMMSLSLYENRFDV